MLAGHPRHPADLHAGGHAALRAAAGRRRAVGPRSLLRGAAGARGPRAGVHHRPRVRRRRRRRRWCSATTSSTATISRCSSSARGAARRRARRSSPIRSPIPSATAWRSSTPTGRVREPRGEAEAAEVALRGHRALLLRQPRARHRGGPEALGARRARDHRRQPGATSSAARSRCEVMGRGMAWLDTGTHESLLEAGAVHRDDRAAAGAEDRLPRGDRLSPGLHRRRAASSGSARRWRRTATASICSRCCASRTSDEGRRRPRSPDVMLDRAARVRRRARLLLRELERARTSPPRASPRRSCRTTIRARARGVLRGLHYQIEHAQGKLVRVVAGEVFDVASTCAAARRRSAARSAIDAVGRRTGGCCGCRRASRTASSRCPSTRSSSTRPPTTGIRSTSARCCGTTPRSASPGRSPGAPILTREGRGRDAARRGGRLRVAGATACRGRRFS